MTNYENLLEQVRAGGMDYKWSRMFVKKLADDEKAFHVEQESAKWAMERGFFPGRMELYGLNENNSGDYIPDYNYFMLHPINHHFRIWVNDKLTLKYVLNNSGCGDTMPDYYLYIENDGRYTYLMDCPTHLSKDENFLWSLLKYKKILALKPNSGTSGGLGFIKLEIKDGELYENNNRIDESRFTEIRDKMRNYIVTEYVHQNEQLSRIWPNSECTLRVIMCKDYNDSFFAPATWTNVISYARFGTSINGGASNLSSGGVGVGFNFEDGKYNDVCIRYKKYCEDGQWRLTKHPDTQAVWAQMSLPNWDIVRQNIENICRYLSSLSYLGFDIIITEDGMKLCEINTHPAMDYEQVMCGPALTNDKVRSFFEHKGLYSFTGKDFYTAVLKAQE